MELQMTHDKLKEENQDLHKKIAQAKASIIVGSQSSTSSPNILNQQPLSRPESSNMRMRIEDSRTKSKLSELPAHSDLGDNHHLRQN